MSEARAYTSYSEDPQFNTIQSDSGKLLLIHEKRLKREQDKRRNKKNRKRLVMVMICTLSLVGVFGCFIYTNSLVAEATYNNYDLNQQIADLNDQKDAINAKIDSTIVLKNVEQYAMEELGMQYPKPEQTIYIDGMSELALESTKVESIENDTLISQSEMTPVVIQVP